MLRNLVEGLYYPVKDLRPTFNQEVFIGAENPPKELSRTNIKVRI